MKTDYLKTDCDRGFDAGIRQARREALKEAVAACENEQQGFLSPEYATNQPVSSISERFACSQCAGAIRALIDQESKEPLATPAPSTGKAERPDLVDVTLVYWDGTQRKLKLPEHFFAGMEAAQQQEQEG